jgi:hypothetical protein
MKIPGKSAGSGGISGLSPRFAGRGRLNPAALRHQKGEQKSNRESHRLETAAANQNSSNRESERPHCDSRAGTPTARPVGERVHLAPGLAVGVGCAVDGGSSIGTERRNAHTQCHDGREVNPRPYNGNSESQKRRLAACSTSRKPNSTSAHKSHLTKFSKQNREKNA